MSRKAIYKYFNNYFVYSKSIFALCDFINTGKEHLDRIIIEYVLK